mmetsp:Transcript_49723/g.75106  ORF Transcript_49723/g.75106 Transcript_49723/m.75106 type:complete len:358 (+) Transcript_49723:581-1654(+)
MWSNYKKTSPLYAANYPYSHLVSSSGGGAGNSTVTSLGASFQSVPNTEEDGRLVTKTASPPAPSPSPPPVSSEQAGNLYTPPPTHSKPQPLHTSTSQLSHQNYPTPERPTTGRKTRAILSSPQSSLALDDILSTPYSHRHDDFITSTPHASNLTTKAVTTMKKNVIITGGPISRAKSATKAAATQAASQKYAFVTTAGSTTKSMGYYSQTSKQSSKKPSSVFDRLYNNAKQKSVKTRPQQPPSYRVTNSRGGGRIGANGSVVSDSIMSGRGGGRSIMSYDTTKYTNTTISTLSFEDDVSSLGDDGSIHSTDYGAKSARKKNKPGSVFDRLYQSGKKTKNSAGVSFDAIVKDQIVLNN